MTKTHHVFITIKEDELFRLVHDYLKRKGKLKNIPSDAEILPFDDSVEVCLEYQWDEN